MNIKANEVKQNVGERLKNLDSGARWLIASAAILLFLLISSACSIFWMFTSVILTDGCAQLPQWMGFYLVLPPAFLGIGSILPPILFALKQRIQIVIAALLFCVFVSFLLSIAWLPLIASYC